MKTLAYLAVAAALITTTLQHMRPTVPVLAQVRCHVAHGGVAQAQNKYGVMSGAVRCADGETVRSDTWLP